MAKAKGKKKDVKLTPKQELFCQFYINDRESFGNGTWAYAWAYDIDIDYFNGSDDEDKTERKSNYRLCSVLASKELTKPKVRGRVNELLKQLMTDEVVDVELMKVISQDGDLSPKVAAIKEYNKLKQRIVEKGEVKVTGTISLTELFEKSKQKADEIPQV